jgi:hypothetical protein
MSEPITITIPDPAAWYYAALVTVLLIPDLQKRDEESTAHFRLGAQGTQHGAERFVFESPLGTVTTTRNDTETTMTIEPAEGEQNYWRTIEAGIEIFAAEARGKRWIMDGLTADELIERYYRARAAGDRKMTLRRLASSQHKYSYTALQKHKQRYDARGGWGSKRRQVVRP